MTDNDTETDQDTDTDTDEADDADEQDQPQTESDRTNERANDADAERELAAEETPGGTGGDSGDVLTAEQYQSMTVDEVKAWVDEHRDDITPDEVDAIIEYERDNNARKTLLPDLRTMRDDIASATVDTDTDDPGEPNGARGHDADDRPQPGDRDFDKNTMSIYERDTVRRSDDIPNVLVRATRAGYIAGDDWAEGEQRHLKRTRRIDEAIVSGDLYHVRDA